MTPREHHHALGAAVEAFGDTPEVLHVRYADGSEEYFETRFAGDEPPAVDAPSWSSLTVSWPEGVPLRTIRYDLDGVGSEPEPEPVVRSRIARARPRWGKRAWSSSPRGAS